MHHKTSTKSRLLKVSKPVRELCQHTQRLTLLRDQNLNLKSNILQDRRLQRLGLY